MHIFSFMDSQNLHRISWFHLSFNIHNTHIERTRNARVTRTRDGARSHPLPLKRFTRSVTKPTSCKKHLNRFFHFSPFSRQSTAGRGALFLFDDIQLIAYMVCYSVPVNSFDFLNQPIPFSLLSKTSSVD